MASPQKENGYTAISNEILERLVNTPLLGSEYQVLFCIIRKTYGYQKKVDIISLSQFQKATGLSRPTVVKTLKNLVTRKMVVKIYLPHDRISFSFNKNYYECVVNISKLVKGKWVASKDVLTETSKDVLTHKRKKETNTKEIAEINSAEGFSLKEEIKKLENNPRRDLNIIALYLEYRMPDIRNKGQFQRVLKRHMRPAKELTPFEDDQIIRAFEKSKEQTKDWTIETAIKNATK